MRFMHLPRPFVARMLNGHSAIGLASAALLYVLCLSGVLMVFHQEFTRWEQPRVPEFASVEGEAAAAAAATALERADGEAHDVSVRLPVAGMPRLAFGVDGRKWYADAAGRPVGPKRHPWTGFLERLHYYLTLPSTIGLALVGILGVLMTALVVTGLLAHPRLFRDAFKLRLGRGRLTRETDTHNRLGVWAAPFHLIIAFTGAALGLAVTVATFTTTLEGEGEPLAMFAPIFGAEPAEDPRAASLPDIAAALENFERQHPALVPWYISIHHPATAGQAAELLAQHPQRLIYGDNYRFDAARRLQGNTGLSDGALGQQVFASLYPLHFGTFGGLAVKLIYGVLGVLAAVMVASGGNVWLLKRRQSGRTAAGLERAWAAVVWGTPAALALAFAAAAAGLAQTEWLVGLFWGALLASLLAGVRLSAENLRRYGRIATGGLLVAGVLAHADQWPAALHSIGLSTVLLAVAAALVVSARLRRARTVVEPGSSSTPSSIS